MNPEFVGVLGWPLERTLSPAIHNAAFRRLGIDWIYFRWPVPPHELEAAVGGLRVLGAMGANVTIPHKEAVIPLLDEIGADARAVGAVNTIQRSGGRLIGHNTDVVGFAEFVAGDAGVDVKGRSAVVLGAGGAARAVVKALDDLGATRIAIAARTEARGAALTALARAAEATVETWDRAPDAIAQADVIVNATPLGGDGRDPVPHAEFASHHVVVDLVYYPPVTPLMERARAAGGRAWGGLGMLVRQAAESLRLWTGQNPPLETMSAAALHALGRGRPANQT